MYRYLDRDFAAQAMVIENPTPPELSTSAITYRFGPALGDGNQRHADVDLLVKSLLLLAYLYGTRRKGAIGEPRGPWVHVFRRAQGVSG
jgi:hypothetical protein